MCKFLTHLLTGPDNATFDIARVLWVIGVICYLGLASWDVLKTGHAPDLMSFAQGFGLMLAAGGAAVGVKGHTEPKP